ncbi:MAG TPA: phosphohistidine phosphatase SixA [Terriglobia bacterium]|nr:phosphohistidine phosphatase SixA [Terriglobia bacterium]
MPSLNDRNESKDAQEYQLYVMRHGIAVARDDPNFPDDTQRPLTPEGRKKLRAVAKGLSRLGLSVDSIITSPLVRASETAALVAEVLDSGVKVEPSDFLRPGGSLQALLASLGKRNDQRSVLVVGHEPDLSDGVAKLIGNTRASFQFKKGGCCRIDFDKFPPRPPGKLIWWLTPRVMRKIG